MHELPQVQVTSNLLSVTKEILILVNLKNNMQWVPINSTCKKD